MMHRTIPSTAVLIVGLTILLAVTAHTQVIPEGAGRITGMSGKSVIAEFTDVTVSVGDEVEVQRLIDIIDPVTGIVRGVRTVVVAICVVTDIGLNKAVLKVVNTQESREITSGDLVFPTGAEKEIVNIEAPEPEPQEPWYMDYENRRKMLTIATIDSLQQQLAPDHPDFDGIRGGINEINEDEMITTLGGEDDISEGDIFLIQRTEPVYDPVTNEITGTNEINVARIRVRDVSDSTSVSEFLEKKYEPQITDSVIRESDYYAYLNETFQSDLLKVADLEHEIGDLKRQVAILRGEVETLHTAQRVYVDDFAVFRDELEVLLSQLMQGDLGEVRLVMKNDETSGGVFHDDLLTWYRRTLDICLEHEYDSAIMEFNAIIERHPQSRLTENCRYWIGQSRFNKKEYLRAADLFRKVIEDTRFEHKDDDASVMLGITYIRMNDRSAAQAEFRRFLDTYPDSEFRSTVENWLARLSIQAGIPGKRG